MDDNKEKKTIDWEKVAIIIIIIERALIEMLATYR